MTTRLTQNLRHLLATVILPSVAFAQSYSVAYPVSGTIGQPDSGGPMTGGNFSLTGGFWALYTVQTPGAPLLTIRWVNPTMVKISWASPSADFVLQQTSSLSPANWSNYPGTVDDNGTTRSVTISPPSNIWFFRLMK